MEERKRFTTAIINQLVKEKIIELDDTKYVITQKGKEFRGKMLKDTGLDIDEEVDWVNQKMQGYILEKMDGENLRVMIKDGFFTKEQVKDIKFCVENNQPINIGLTVDQANELMEINK